MELRTATVDDVPLLFALLNESAAEQGFPDEVVVTEADLREDGFGATPRFHVTFAEVHGEPAGIALWFYMYSTWVSRLGLYLEDLYVRPEFRGKGVGTLLLTHLANVAVENGCRRMTWLVHASNEPAIRLYEKFGARHLSDWQLMSMKNEALHRAAR